MQHPTLDLSDAHLRTLRALLAECVPGAEVWAYGSRVNGGSHPGSDLDLVVRDPAKPGAGRGGLARLKGAMAESNLPIVIEVHDWARLPESFRKEIDRAHVVVQEAGGDRDQ